MSDEQIIYIGPEDDLTSIRERLENIQSKQVTLVIPSNTQLRSPVAWRLLYVRAREMGKEVLIVSSDAQIRSVAHSVKFRVATSLESSSTPAKPRPASRPSRAPAGSKLRPTSTGSMRSSSGRTNTRGTGGIGNTRTRTAGSLHHRPDERPFAQSGLGPESRPSQPEELLTEGIEDLPVKRFGSSTYSSHSPRIDSIDSVPSIHPLTPEQSEEAPDYQIDEEFFREGREMREAALGGRQYPENSPEDPEETIEHPSVKSQPSAAPRPNNLPQIVDDPYDYMGDETPSRLPHEQRGSVSMHHIHTDEHEIQDVPDTPTEGDDIEYKEGDTGVFLPAPEHIPYEEDEEDIAGPSSNSLHIRPHSSRPQAREDIAAQRQRDNELEQDIQPSIEDLPTRVTPSAPIPMSPLPPQRPAAPSRRSTPLQQPSSSPRRSTPLQQPAAPSRRSTPLQQPSSSPRRSTPLQQPGSSPRRSTPLQQTTARDRSAMTSPPRQPDTSRISQRPTVSPAASRSQGVGRQVRRPARPAVASTSSSGRGRVIVLAAAILLILLAGALAVFAPTANVVITLQPRTYSHALNLVARSDSQQTTAPGTVASQQQTHTFTITGTATASGSKPEYLAQATGNAIFTNNSRQPISIPTGTIISNASGVQFTTQADIVVNIPKQPGNPITVPIQAVNKGAGGNLAADTITVIPQSSLDAIAKANNISAADLALTVTNGLPTSGGGQRMVPAILQKDLDTAKNNLLTQIKTQPATTTWLKQWNANGNIASQPTINATLVNAPPDGQIVDNTSVPVTLNATFSVLVVSSNDLQRAAIAQLNASMKNEPSYQDYIVPTDVQQPVKISTPKGSSKDATTLTITANATTPAVHAISSDDVRKEISGMTSQAAQDMLSKQPGIESVNISVSPSADPWLPFWPANTHIVLQVGTK